MSYNRDFGRWTSYKYEDFDIRDKELEDLFNGEDVINNPSHYTQGDIECIDAMRSALTEEEFRGYCKGAAMKYIWRERYKGGNESLQKAVWYLEKINE